MYAVLRLILRGTTSASRTDDVLTGAAGPAYAVHDAMGAAGAVSTADGIQLGAAGAQLKLANIY